MQTLQGFRTRVLPDRDRVAGRADGSAHSSDLWRRAGRYRFRVRRGGSFGRWDISCKAVLGAERRVGVVRHGEPQSRRRTSRSQLRHCNRPSGGRHHRHAFPQFRRRNHRPADVGGGIALQENFVAIFLSLGTCHPISDCIMTDKKAQYLIEGITKDIVAYLMEDRSLALTEAIAMFHNSETFTKLSDPQTGLYIESSAYVYEILKTELKMGKIE